MKPNLLIVDDEKPTRDGLRAALEDRYEVYLAEDSASAVHMLETESFEVLLTDVLSESAPLSLANESLLVAISLKNRIGPLNALNQLFTRPI